MRRRAAVLAVMAVGAAMEWKPSFSFRDSAKWVVDRAPGRYAQALRDLGACLPCDARSALPLRSSTCMHPSHHPRLAATLHRWPQPAQPCGHSDL